MATTSILSENESSHNDLAKRIESLTFGALPYYKSILKNLYQANRQNTQILCDFITMEHENQNIKISTKLTHIKIICWFSKYLDYRNFQLITRDDIIHYLNSLKKSESVDPFHKWIGTY